ncbi:CocE/NonD family hydrolase [Peribacillus frigoritolerans]|nr:CocE/NonD family hydrolase [Peribacillus frigoritolerans]
MLWKLLIGSQKQNWCDGNIGMMGKSWGGL